MQNGPSLQQTPPLEDAAIEELFALWESIFGPGAADIDRGVFGGAEEEFCRSVLFCEQAEGAVGGTCFTMHDRTLPLAGFGEVATRPDWRARGIASRLCGAAVRDFQAHGGEAFFLGTGNPAAARIYHRLGWRKIVGNNVMVHIASGHSPEEYLVDYFRRPGDVSVVPATAAVRVRMIPLLVTPHDWKVLDANVGSRSCRYFNQVSCMGLYPRYVRGTADRGCFFAAVAEDGRVVGLSSVAVDPDGVRRVDGFAHANFAAALGDLVRAAGEWDGGSGPLEATIAVEDEEKRDAFVGLGFAARGAGKPFDFDGRKVQSWILRRD